MPRILVTGATGLLGIAVVAEARRRGLDVVAVARHAATLSDGIHVTAVDLTEEGTPRRLVASARPNFVLNLAALTNVDACEDDPDDAHRLHVDAAGSLAAEAAREGARLVHVSTDSVFSGPGSPFGEEAPPHPLNVYASTKLLGEAATLAANPSALVVRTNFFGSRDVPGGRSLAEWALGELEASRSIEGFEDVVFNPLWTGHLAGFLLDLAAGAACGRVHVAASDATSKFAFLRSLAAAFGHDPVAVRPATQAARRWRAPRPLCTVLDVSRAESLLAVRMPDVAAGIGAFRAWHAGLERARPSSGGADARP